MKLDKKTVLGLLLVLGFAQFLFVMMLGEGMAPGYSMHTNSISDLGTYPATELMFNTSVIVLGIANLAVGFLIYSIYGCKLLLALFTVAGLAAIGIGLSPLDVNESLHGIFALTAFLFVNLEVIFGSKLVKNPLKILSILLGLVGISFTVVMFLVDSGSIGAGAIGHGSVERMIVFPGLLWLMIFGGYQLSSAAAEKSLKEPEQKLVES